MQDKEQTKNTSAGVQRKRKKQDLSPRTAPVQGRSKKRSKEILDVTGELLEKVGLDDLSTILIAREVGISVGSLYHYFPNKHAILYAMAQRWLDDIKQVMSDMSALPVEEMELEVLLDQMLQLNLKVYKRQKAVLMLVQAMFSVPELKELDIQHDDMVISHMAALFKRMGIKRHLKERERLGRVYLETSHSIFLVAVHQKGERARRTLADLKFMLCSLLERHLMQSEADDPGSLR
ncbi:TetR/AcrR family transcriptional regulator [Oceanospirillum sp. D5]|uniref:TetR/AcrR family transcriptional regulator n=2 Tax=Oceanospirillum sediminis TaxID=2760088 RepID=A0A839IQW2_9GAMM|nr:TetR/AcrR family transcriptional regulator [Oceanospirillum sediminis]